MHTILVILGGLVLLAFCLLVGRATDGSGGMARAALWFLPLWLIATLVNMWVGVSRAGYTVAQEAPVALVVFIVPALIALALRRWGLAAF